MKKKKQQQKSLFTENDFNETTFKRSEEQENIIKALETHPIINVNSLSGTGKTTLLENIAKEFNNETILYIVFNKANQIEAEKRFPTNTLTKTLNGVAYGYVRKHTNINLNFDNIINYSAKEVSKIYKIGYGQAIHALDMFNQYCISDNTKFPRNSKVAKQMFTDMINNKIKITHDFYVKYFQIMLMDEEVELYYDIGMLDESQDTNLVTLDIFKRMNFKRRIYVGDKNQRIYSFRGSQDIFSFTDGKEYQLTETFRCHKDIAEVANIILQRFKGAIKPLRSEITKKGKVKTKAFLSRTNSELIRQMDTFIKDDKKFKTIRNPELIFQLVVDVYYFQSNQKHMIKRNFYLKDFKNMNELNDYAKEVNDRELLSAIKISDSFGSKIFKIKNVANEYFYSHDKFKNFLSTAHTAKGLEWDRVTILDDFNIFSKLIAETKNETCEDFRNVIDELPADIVDEVNLYYIAITRAKFELKMKGHTPKELFISEKELDLKIKEILEEA